MKNTPEFIRLGEKSLLCLGTRLFMVVNQMYTELETNDAIRIN